MKLYIENNLPGTIEFCCGDKECELEPDQVIEIEVIDEDCLFLDTLK